MSKPETNFVEYRGCRCQKPKEKKKESKIQLIPGNLFIYLFIYYLFIHLFIHLFISFIHSFIYLFLFIFIYLFIYLFIYSFIYFYLFSFPVRGMLGLFRFKLWDLESCSLLQFRENSQRWQVWHIWHIWLFNGDTNELFRHLFWQDED